MEKICPHFHLSLQSGCDATLKRMNRHYTCEDYLYRCGILRKYFRDPAITTDVIVGFPGETDEEFAETKKFLEESWPEQFSEELERWFQVSGEQQLSVAVVKNMFQQNLRQLIQSILEEYHFEESFREKWRQEESLVSLISSAASSTELKDRALEYMQGFQEAALRAGAQNPLMEVLNYIDQHLDGKLTLPELAQMSCMSVPSFCKKFKEQTKMTVTQYINEKRVAYAATLLKQSKYSLEEVAELAGFSNANYLLRVFKKSTGKTIGQYRKQIKF